MGSFSAHHYSRTATVAPVENCCRFCCSGCQDRVSVSVGAGRDLEKRSEEYWGSETILEDEVNLNIVMNSMKHLRN